MRLPRKGILIRIAVYGTLLAFFGWQAWTKHRAEKELAAEQAAHTRSATLPDGRTIEYMELTPEQAERMFGVPPAVERGAPDAAPAPAPEGAAAAPVAPPGPPETAPAAPAN